MSGVQVRILEFELRKGTDGEYVVFEMVCSSPEDNALQLKAGNFVQWRRFSEFELMWRYLQFSYPQFVIPPLPEKKVNFKVTKMSVDKLDTEFNTRRRDSLKTFINRILSHPVLSSNPAFKSFLVDDDWKLSLTVQKDGVTIFWSPSAIDDFIRTRAASVRTKFIDKKFLALKVYADSFQDKLTLVLNTHGKLARQTMELFEQYQLYAKIFQDWSIIPGEHPDLARRIAHFTNCLDQLDREGDARLRNEESTFVEPLKDYVYFCESLRDIVMKQEVVQYEFEKATAAVESKEKDLREMEKPTDKGVRGFFNSLKTMTDEERKSKVALLSSQLDALREAYTASEVELTSFADAAITDLERYHQQKVRDLKAVFLEYIKLQKKYCEQSLAVWKAFKANIVDPKNAE